MTTLPVVLEIALSSAVEALVQRTAAIEQPTVKELPCAST